VDARLHEIHNKKTSTSNIQMVTYYIQDYRASGHFPPSNALNRTQYAGKVIGSILMYREASVQLGH
jgi:hypothetical protein